MHTFCGAVDFRFQILMIFAGLAHMVRVLSLELVMGMLMGAGRHLDLESRTHGDDRGWSFLVRQVQPPQQ